MKNRCSRYRLGGLTIAAVVLLAAAPQWRSHAQSLNPPEPPPPDARIFEQLNLSSEQIQRVRQIFERDRARGQSQREALFREEETLKSMLAGTASRTDIETQFERVQDLRSQTTRAKFQNMLEVREVLTPVQREQFAKLARDRRERRAPRRLPRRQGGF